MAQGLALLLTGFTLICASWFALYFALRIESSPRYVLVLVVLVSVFIAGAMLMFAGVLAMVFSGFLYLLQ